MSTDTIPQWMRLPSARREFVLQDLQLAPDISIGELVRALAPHGLSISNFPDRPLRIVRSPAIRALKEIPR
jgi:hypothetical protein